MNNWVWFGAGFLACWAIAGAVAWMADRWGWYESKAYLRCMCLPWAPAALLVVILQAIVNPWMLLVVPVDRKIFEGLLQRGKWRADVKTYKPGKHIYFCIEKNAPLLYRAFFARVKDKKPKQSRESHDE